MTNFEIFENHLLSEGMRSELIIFHHPMLWKIFKRMESLPEVTILRDNDSAILVWRSPAHSSLSVSLTLTPNRSPHFGYRCLRMETSQVTDENIKAVFDCLNEIPESGESDDDGDYA